MERRINRGQSPLEEGKLEYQGELPPAITLHNLLTLSLPASITLSLVIYSAVL
jgi:hypothetical protein